jgi:hypothetical protein
MKDILKVKAVVIPLSLMFFFNAEVLFSQQKQEFKPPQPSKSQDTTIQETYISKVIISAPYSKKNLVYDGEQSPPGEFGVSQYAVQESLKLCVTCFAEGPSAFTVAPNGEIFITDPLNKRIQRFNANGRLISVIPHIEGSHWDWSLICVDRNDKVYILLWHDLTRQSLSKYDLNGKLLTTYEPFNDLREPVCGSELHCDQNGKLFLQYYRRPENNAEFTIAAETKIKGPILSLTFQIGTTESVFTFEQQKSTLRTGVLEYSGLSKINLRKLGESFREYWGPPMWNNDFVDEKGNFYQFWSTNEGITITKWYKK